MSLLVLVDGFSSRRRGIPVAAVVAALASSVCRGAAVSRRVHVVLAALRARRRELALLAGVWRATRVAVVPGLLARSRGEILGRSAHQGSSVILIHYRLPGDLHLRRHRLQNQTSRGTIIVLLVLVPSGSGYSVLDRFVVRVPSVPVGRCQFVVSFLLLLGQVVVLVIGGQ